MMPFVDAAASAACTSTTVAPCAAAAARITSLNASRRAEAQFVAVLGGEVLDAGGRIVAGGLSARARSKRASRRASARGRRAAHERRLVALVARERADEDGNARGAILRSRRLEVAAELARGRARTAASRAESSARRRRATSACRRALRAGPRAGPSEASARSSARYRCSRRSVAMARASVGDRALASDEPTPPMPRYSLWPV